MPGDVQDVEKVIGRSGRRQFLGAAVVNWVFPSK